MSNKNILAPLTNEERLEIVLESISRVPKETNDAIRSLSVQMSPTEIIQQFNQQALELFTYMTKLAIDRNVEQEIKTSGYKTLFTLAIKSNIKLPIEKFTLTILQSVAEIYSEDEQSFLKMTIPDQRIGVGNEFTIITSETFKNLWLTLKPDEKERLKNNIILLTTYAHAYFFYQMSQL